MSSVDAQGGAGGNSNGGAGGAGGRVDDVSATASGDGATTSVQGMGGDAGSGMGGGGAGGTVVDLRASAYGIEDAEARASAVGGDGGDSTNGDGGDGASVRMVNAVTGSTQGGTLDLEQSDLGGNGGGIEQSDAHAGVGGDALSKLVVDDRQSQYVSSSLTLEVSAQGGDGGFNLAAEDVGGAGGSATSLGRLIAARTASVYVNIDAQGGAGGSGGFHDPGGDAHATGAAAGGQVFLGVTAFAGAGNASASGSADRLSGIATASGSAAAASGNAYISASATTESAITRLTSLVQAPLAGHSAFQAWAAVGGALPHPASTLQGSASALGLPDAATVGAIAGSHPQIAAAFAGAQALVTATLAMEHSTGDAGGTQTIVADVDTVVSLYGVPAPGELVLGLFGGRAIGAFAGSVTIDVHANGVDLLDQTFTSAASAKSFFRDHAIDLGGTAQLAGSGGSIDLDIRVTTATSAVDSGFSAGFIVGNEPGAGGSQAGFASAGALALLDVGHLAEGHLAPMLTLHHPAIA